MEEEGLGKKLVILGLTGVLAVLSHLARALSSSEPLKARHVIGGMLTAWVAAVSFGALIRSYWEVDTLFLVGFAGLVGHMGGGAFHAMAKLVESKTGIDLNGDGKSR